MYGFWCIMLYVNLQYGKYEILKSNFNAPKSSGLKSHYCHLSISKMLED